MVRFARAEGSKGSNKRALEEATPWSQMVGQRNKKKGEDGMLKSHSMSREMNKGGLKKNKKKNYIVENAVRNPDTMGKKGRQKAEKDEEDNKRDKTALEVTNPAQRASHNKDDEEVKLETALFNGVWVTKEGAARLDRLKGDLKKKGVSKEELRMVMKREQRKEEKYLRRERKRVCLRCRKRGHLVRDCPEINIDYGIARDICYVCGSTEHGVSNCSQKDKGLGYPHASCYVCKRMGHIARQCPQNPRGLYPNGGSCRGCSSVEHLASNCPHLQAEREAAEIKASRIDGTAVESLDVNKITTFKKNTITLKKKRPKVISF